MAELRFDPYSGSCPSRQLLNDLGGQWTVLTVGALSEGPLRFTDISTRVDGISMKMLTQTLRSLERDGLVTRTKYAQSPPRVDYELTETGRELVEPLKALEDWAIAHMGEILDRRARSGT